MAHLLAYGLLTTHPVLQPLLAALRAGADDTALASFMTTMAVLFTDLSGWSAHPQVSEGLRRVLQMEKALQAVLPAFDATLVKSLGDSHLCLFASVTHAVAAVDALHAALPENPFCAGIGWGPVIVCRHRYGRLDVFGHAVSLASRLGEDIATGTQCLLSAAAYEQLSPAQQARCTPGVQAGFPYWALADGCPSA